MVIFEARFGLHFGARLGITFEVMLGARFGLYFGPHFGLLGHHFLSEFGSSFSYLYLGLFCSWIYLFDYRNDVSFRGRFRSSFSLLNICLRRPKQWIVLDIISELISILRASCFDGGNDAHFEVDVFRDARFEVR